MKCYVCNQKPQNELERWHKVYFPPANFKLLGGKQKPVCNDCLDGVKYVLDELGLEVGGLLSPVLIRGVKF